MTPEDIEKHQQSIEKQQAAVLEQQHHTETIQHLNILKETNIAAMRALVDFLNKKVTKTEVTNQLTKIGTPDVQNVVEAVDKLRDDFMGKEIDWTPLIMALKPMQDELAKIPKDHPELPEQQEVDFTGTNERLDKIEEAIQALDLVVAAPVVNVPAQKAPVVHVDPVDLKPIKEPILKLLAAVRVSTEQYVAPEPTDLSKVEKLLAAANEELKKIVKKPVSGGGGGGGGGPVFKANAALGLGNDLIYPELTADGKLPVDAEVSIDTDGLATEDNQELMIVDLDYRYAGGKIAHSAVLSSSGDNTFITPAAGKRIQIYWVSFIPNSDNTAANLVSVKLGAQTPYINYATAHWELFTGEPDEQVVINLSNNQPVAVTIHYKEIT